MRLDPLVAKAELEKTLARKAAEAAKPKPKPAVKKKAAPKKKK